ncbi:MAG TPA: DUF1801 domain-containing protein [Isosphaeraceae bacterium]|jgi:hypothetical protein|nr:DUF1801 domain-containing protein [Isosphaeraceae bacterium]
MSKSRESKSSDGADGGRDAIAAYSQARSPEFRAICDQLRALIDSALPSAASKVWHGAPVWFIDENPVVGYKVAANAVNLLFWNGQAFDEPAFKPVGKYRAAQATFKEAGEIDPKVIRRWLKKAKSDVFDSNAFFKALRERKKVGSGLVE